MSEGIRVLVLGTGQMGSGIARMVHEKPGLHLVGAFARRPERFGMDVGRAIGLAADLGIGVHGILDEAVDRCRPDVAVQATCSTLEDAWSEIVTLLERGVRVVSIAEEMAYPACASQRTADEMHALAVEHAAAAVGTGINPGFVLDLLVIALTGVCRDIRSIKAERINDLSAYGPSVLEAQGVGLSPQAFRAGVADGTVSGHFGFAQSIHMIADAIGWRVERIEETREPIVSKVRRETPFVTVEPGQVAGCLHSARAYRDGQAVITLIHPQQIRPELENIETRDTIDIDGTPPVRLSGSPEISGGQGTVSLAVNMIPRILAAPPGLHTMATLPVPTAMLGDQDLE